MSSRATSRAMKLLLDATDDAGPPATAEEVEAVSTWSAGELKQWLEDCGMAKKVALGLQ